MHSRVGTTPLWLRKKPAKRVLCSALITLLGVALLTLRTGPGLGFGEMLGMLTALLYACAILLTDTLSHRGDALMMGVIQVGCMGALFMRERLGRIGFLGAALILAGILVQTPKKGTPEKLSPESNSL